MRRGKHRAWNEKVGSLSLRLLRATEGCDVHEPQAGNTLELLHVERGDLVARRQAGGGDLQVVRADHHTARLQLGPEPGMAAGFRQVEGLDEDGSQISPGLDR